MASKKYGVVPPSYVSWWKHMKGGKRFFWKKARAIWKREAKREGS